MRRVGGGGFACPDAGGTSVNCTPTTYRCEPGQGVCLTQCTTINDCIPPYVCDTGGKCVSPSATFTAAPAGCSLSAYPAPDEGPWERVALLLLPALAAATRRRRGRDQQPTT